MNLERDSPLREAVEALLRVAFRDEDFLTQNGIPMTATPGVRRALRALRAALADSDPMTLDVERLARALDLCGIGLVDGHAASDWAPHLAHEYARLSSEGRR